MFKLFPDSPLMSLLLLLIIPEMAMGQGAELFQMKILLEDRIFNIMRGFDPDAVVNAKIEVEKSANVKLPQTLITVKSIDLQDGQGRLKIKMVDVQIFTSAPISQETKLLITSVASHLFQGATVSYVKPLGGYKLKPQQIIDLTDRSADAKKSDSSTEDQNSWIEDLSEVVGDWTGSHKVALLASSVAVGLVVVFLVVNYLLIMMTLRRQTKVLEQGLKKMASAFEASAGAQEPAGMSAQIASQNATGSNEKAAGSRDLSSIEKAMAELPDDGALALLYDCYWCELDGYARFIWSRLQVARRQKFLGLDVLLRDYVEYFSSADEVDLGVDGDVYYLAPLPINKVPNSALMELAAKYPAILRKLPSLRIERFAYEANERLDLEARASKEPDSQPDFSALQGQSQPRVLKKKIKLRIKSDADEEKIRAQNIQDPDIMKTIPSLLWVERLSDEALSDVLQNFNSNELASAWIGPTTILDRMKSLLPERKRVMLEERVTSMKPSRDSRAYLTLHQQVVSAFEAGQSKGEVKEPEAKQEPAAA